MQLEIQLNETEQKICDLLDKCTTHLKEQKGITTSCRIAGGWVRDKLLGKESDDIDVALTDMMGLPFAEHLAEYAHSQGIETGSVGKIAQNPDQSKHLETATLRVYGLDIDLVNLRSEQYATDSRIPTEVTFGTPLQDALRRDITINALFYNLHSRTVEDFTEKGLDDLKNGIVRTPLSPKETFLDDPLRVLRCIRFASRLGFSITPEIEQAAKDPEIQTAVVAKVTRERAGIEVAKMMKGPNPLRSIELINGFSLYDPIFSVFPARAKATLSGELDPVETAVASAAILNSLVKGNTLLADLHPHLFNALAEDSTCKGRLFLAAALRPYGNLTFQDEKNKTQSAVWLSLWESLRLGTQNHFLDGIPPLFTAAKLLSKPDLNHARFQKPSKRVAIGLLLRDKSVHNPVTGSHWTSSLLFSLVQDLLPFYNLSDRRFEDGANDIIEMHNRFIIKVEMLDLLGVVDAKPLLDGRQVVSVLNAKPGQWTGQVLAKVMEWQLDNPQGSKDDCITWLREQRANGTIDIPDNIAEPTSKKARRAR